MIEDLHLKVIIPCYKEPEILKTLQSISACILPKNKVDVIVLINHAIDSSQEIKTFNQKTLFDVQNWIEKNKTNKIHFLPKLVELKQQSVGLARKTGMDWAYELFQSENVVKNGIMVALDADCTVEDNYLIAIEKHFLTNNKTPAASIYYEHQTVDNQLIIEYELHLRYLVDALRWTGHPYAFQTVGSSMVVRAEAYKKQGGMNTRQAGEDFYFLQKMMDLGGFTDISTTKVFPSARVSDRVPFGTGRAMQQKEVLQSWMSYDFRSYIDIKSLVDFVPNLYQNQIFRTQSVALKQFLKSISFDDKCDEIRNNTANFTAFKKRFFQYFNGFQVMKFLNYSKENYYLSQPICQAIEPLVAILFPNHQLDTPKIMLERFRNLDKNTIYNPE